MALGGALAGQVVPDGVEGGELDRGGVGAEGLGGGAEVLREPAVDEPGGAAALAAATTSPSTSSAIAGTDARLTWIPSGHSSRSRASQSAGLANSAIATVTSGRARRTSASDAGSSMHAEHRGIVSPSTARGAASTSASASSGGTTGTAGSLVVMR